MHRRYQSRPKKTWFSRLMLLSGLSASNACLSRFFSGPEPRRPSAEMCIWEWKRQIFLTNNPGLEDQFAELSLEGVRRKIQHWLDRQSGYPKEQASEEYGFY